MNIGIACYPTYGGSGVVATELGKGLARRGHKVHFITYQEPARLHDTFNANIFYHEVRLSDYPLFDYAPYETALASKLVDVALYANLDVFHVHYAIPHASAAFMARQILLTKGKDVPVITTRSKQERVPTILSAWRSVKAFIMPGSLAQCACPNQAAMEG